MRKWLIALTALVVVVVGADFGLRLLAEYSVGRGLQNALSLSERPSVSMGGFPFIPELVTGNVDSVTMRANGSSSEDRVSLESVMLTLHDVSFSPGQLLVGGRSRIIAMSGEGTAELTEEDLNRAVGSSVPATIHLRHDRVVIRWDQIEQEIAATASISDASVVLQPVEPSLPLLSVDLPKLVKGLTYREVRIERDVATLSFTLHRAVFEIERS
jgi:LmeA-like phospholipid-binding